MPLTTNFAHISFGGGTPGGFRTRLKNAHRHLEKRLPLISRNRLCTCSILCFLEQLKKRKLMRLSFASFHQSVWSLPIFSIRAVIKLRRAWPCARPCKSDFPASYSCAICVSIHATSLLCSITHFS